MRLKNVRALAVVAAAVFAVSNCPMNAIAETSTAGVSTYTTNVLSNQAVTTAGVATTFGSFLSDNVEDSILEEAKANILANEDKTVADSYYDVAIAQVRNYVYIRSEANGDAEYVGKLYNNSAATIISEEGGWYKVSSGNVTGYVCAEYVVVGDKELIDQVSRRTATVTTETLKVRKEAGADANVLGLVPEGDDLTVIDESIDGWVGVSVEEGTGYVSADYVTLSTEFTYAESKEEEIARLAREEAARKAAQEAAAKAAKKNKKNSSSSSSSSSSGSNKSYSAPSGSDGQAVANYACQFVGNPYEYGGSSLTEGTDCSGFVMSVYAAFGVSLPHSSKSMRSYGYEVSVDEMQPGDIICYSGHVAIYVGNNTIVHASTKSTGIKYTSPANYKTIICVRRIF